MWVRGGETSFAEVNLICQGMDFIPWWENPRASPTSTCLEKALIPLKKNV